MCSLKHYLSDNKNLDVDGLGDDVRENFLFAKNTLPLLAANCSEYVVAHSSIKLQPARTLREVAFVPHILNTMNSLRLTKLLRLQSYAWTHLIQGADYGAVIVGAPRSGRTLSFVPPLCQVVFNRLTEQPPRGQPCRLQGPIALVLAANMSRVNQIRSLCSALLREPRNEDWLTTVLTVPSARQPEFFQRLLNGVGCLVATPVQFLRICEYSIKFPDLHFVAYDDVDLMPAEQLRQVHHVLLGLTKQHRPQLVITSQSFNLQLLPMLRDYSSKPMILFGDFLEAAVYGRVNIRISLQERKAKCDEIVRVLRKRPPHRSRTVVCCQTDDDIQEVVKALETCGYMCLPYYQTADMEVREQVHRWMQQSRGEVLVYSDLCPELDVRHAQTLLHYSLSNNWSLFKMRHLALSDNLCNQLAQPTDQSKTDTACGLLSVALLDETNMRQLPRLVDFLQMHQEVDATIVQLARSVRLQLEQAKIAEPLLCDQLLSFGDCLDARCEQSHQLLPQDSILSTCLPASGDVKFQVLRVYTPVHYCVHLLEHMPPGGSWNSLPRQATLEMQLQLLLSQQCERHWPPLVKQICVFHNGNGYERVRILRVAPIAHLNISQTNVAVKVQAIDMDTRVFMTTSGKLFRCPESIRDVAPLATDLRILGLVPYTGERNWIASDCQQCAYWLNTDSQTSFLQAHVVGALPHTLFVQDLALMSYASSLKLYVRQRTMCQQLLRNQLAKRCEHTKAKVLKFLEMQNCQVRDEQKITMPGQSPTAPVVDRMAQLFKIGMQLGKENRLRLEGAQRQRQLQSKENKLGELVAAKTVQSTEQQEKSAEDSQEALHECLLKAILMELSEKNAERELLPDECRKVTEALLKEITKPPSELKRTVSQSPKIKNKSNGFNFCQKLSTQIQIPSHILRPEVIYYQTLCTLELQIILPEEQLSYEAVLHKNRCIAFWTLGSPAKASYQFILNTHCPYQQLSHRMQGRTVYVSVLKSLAVEYPLNFAFYKFMKPQHEKVLHLERKRHDRIIEFEFNLTQRGYIRHDESKLVNSSDEPSSDEQEENVFGDSCVELVERADDVMDHN